MMEKIKVISIKPVEGKKFESCMLSDGRSATVWDGNDGNKNLANAIRANLNIECEAEMKQYNGAKGVGYNIRAFAPGNITPVAEKVVETPKANTREASIVAQCLTKIVYRNCPQPGEVEVLDMYKWFLKEL